MATVWLSFDRVVCCHFCGWRKRLGLCFWYWERPWQDERQRWRGGWRAICTCCAQARGIHPALPRAEHQLQETYHARP